MKIPNIYSEYKCPHGKFCGKISHQGFEKKKDVNGRYCKNNCSLYKNHKCKLFR